MIKSEKFKLLYEWSIFPLLNHGPVPLCLLPFPEMFMYLPIALALSLSPLFATTFFLLCNNVWLRRGVAKQWDAPPLSHNCASRMLCRPNFSPEGFKTMLEEKLLLKQYPGARRLFFCESERKMSYWNGTWHCRGEFFCAGSIFHSPSIFHRRKTVCADW